jgi:hypothetical protein
MEEKWTGRWRKLHNEDAGFEVCTAVAMKNAVFWDVARSFEKSVSNNPTRRHIPEDGIVHNEELHNLYSLPSIIRMIKWRRGGHVARMVETRNAYRFLVGKPEGKRPLWRPRCVWVNNINMDLAALEFRVVTGLLWPRIGTSGELLWMS